MNVYPLSRAAPLAAVCALLLTALLAAACLAAPDLTDGALIEVDGRRLFLRCQGDGLPVVVIDTGLGDRAEDWAGLQEQLAAETRVCVYARAGYPPSEPAPPPRDAGVEAAELYALLQEARLPGPYLLVGHSLGGLNAQVFAGLYPQQVAGLVLLDPPPRGWLTGADFPELRALVEQQNALLAEAARQAAGADDPARADFLATLHAEQSAMLGASAALLPAEEALAGLPLVVVASSLPNADFGAQAEPFQAYWIAESRALAACSPRGDFRLAQGSNHNLPVSAPDEVAEAVLSALAAARD